MNPPGWERDGRLLADLRKALPGRPPDPYRRARNTESALAAFVIGRIDGPTELAELVFDSVCDPEPAGLTRASNSTRLLAFRAGRFSIELEIAEDGLIGQVHPNQSDSATFGSVVGQSGRGVFGEATIDEIGNFVLALPPPGPVRLAAHLPGRVLVTSWLVVHR